ncbi:hypothetical protein ACFQ60_00790 [Streptomyces zhihengii]
MIQNCGSLTLDGRSAPCSQGEEPPGPDWEFIGNALRATAVYE